MPRLLARLIAADPEGLPADEVSGGGYAPQPLVLTPADDTWAANPDPVRFDGIPAGVDVAAVEITDGFRPVWQLPLDTGELLPAGATLVLAAGTIRVRLAEWAQLTAGLPPVRG